MCCGATRQRPPREYRGNARGVGTASRVCGAQAGLGSGGGAAVDLGGPAADVALVAWEEHAYALATIAIGRDAPPPCCQSQVDALVVLEFGGPNHLALLAKYEHVAATKGLAIPREEHLLAHLVAARQRLRAARAGSLGVDVASRGCIGRSALVGLRHAAEAEAEAWLWRAVRAYAWALA